MSEMDFFVVGMRFELETFMEASGTLGMKKDQHPQVPQAGRTPVQC